MSPGFPHPLPLQVPAPIGATQVTHVGVPTERLNSECETLPGAQTHRSIEAVPPSSCLPQWLQR